MRKIQLRIPVAEITVNSTPIRNTAPSATGTLICCPSTRLNAVNAVKEIAHYFKGSIFGDRMPIGLEKVVNGAPIGKPVRGNRPYRELSASMLAPKKAPVFDAEKCVHCGK